MEIQELKRGHQYEPREARWDLSKPPDRIRKLWLKFETKDEKQLETINKINVFIAGTLVMVITGTQMVIMGMPLVDGQLVRIPLPIIDTTELKMYAIEVRVLCTNQAVSETLVLYCFGEYVERSPQRKIRSQYCIWDQFHAISETNMARADVWIIPLSEFKSKFVQLDKFVIEFEGSCTFKWMKFGGSYAPSCHARTPFEWSVLDQQIDTKNTRSYDKNNMFKPGVFTSTFRPMIICQRWHSWTLIICWGGTPPPDHVIICARGRSICRIDSGGKLLMHTDAVHTI